VQGEGRRILVFEGLRALGFSGFWVLRDWGLGYGRNVRGTEGRTRRRMLVVGQRMEGRRNVVRGRDEGMEKGGVNGGSERVNEEVREGGREEVYHVEDDASYATPRRSRRRGHGSRHAGVGCSRGRHEDGEEACEAGLDGRKHPLGRSCFSSPWTLCSLAPVRGKSKN
jgi:hypothetical protein